MYCARVGGTPGQAKLLQVSRKTNSSRAKKILRSGDCASSEELFERKQQRVVERHPEEARWRQPAPHGDPVRQLAFDAELVEHPVGIVLALSLLDRSFAASSSLTCSGVKSSYL